MKLSKKYKTYQNMTQTKIKNTNYFKPKKLK